MTGRLAVAALVLTLSGCAAWSWWPLGDSAALLDRADRLAVQGEYEQALGAYDEFLARFPADPAAPRVLHSRETVVSIIGTRRELARLRGELVARDSELARLRQELAARQAESDRLRADLERLKQVDLSESERKKR